MDDLISRQVAIASAISGRIRALPTTEDGEDWIRVSEVRESLKAVPSAQPERCEDCVNFSKTRLLIPQPEPMLYGYPIEHLEMIARVMAKENCTPEDVVRMLQNAGEIAKIVRDEMMEMLKESIGRICKGEANELV